MILLDGMQEVKKQPPGSQGIRKALIGVAITLIAAIFNLHFLSSTSLATTQSTDFRWEGESIIYQGKTFTGPKTATSDDGTRISAGRQYWSYTANGKLEVIVPSNPDNPTQSQAINYQIYDINTETGQASNPSDRNNLTPYENASDYAKSCNIPTIGWIICPISNFLAEGMDYLFDIVAKFVEVAPLPTSRDSLLYRVWGAMRDVANSLFIVVGILLIYSYITNSGALSIYDVKKTLPKILIAVALVNFSFYLCALTVDVFNILGHNIYGLFVNLRDQAVATSDTSIELNWKNATAAALAGVAAIGTVGASIATAGGIVGSIWLILPSLVGALISITIAIITLSARHAIVISLVAIAPIACVAMLLPNTEDLFVKWRKMFINMLAVFPLFSLLFGASQLASDVIISTANNDFPLLVIGLLVKAAPLIVAPVLVKAGDRLIGLVNDKSKGMLDKLQNRTKALSDTKVEEAQMRALADESQARGISRKLMQFADKRKRLTSHRTEAYKNLRDAQIQESLANVDDVAGQKASLLSVYADDRLSGAKESLKRDQQEMRAEALQKLKVTTVPVLDVNGEAVLDADGNEIKKIEIDMSELDNKWEIEIAKASLKRRLDESAAKVAETAQTQTYNEMLAKNVEVPLSFGLTPNATFQMEAAGISRHTQAGQNKVLAAVIANERKDYEEQISNMQKLFAYYGLTNDQIKSLSMGEQDVIGERVERDDTGKVISSQKQRFSINNDLARKAAIEDRMAIGFIPDVQDIINETAEWGTFIEKDEHGNKKKVERQGRNFEQRATVGGTIFKNKIHEKVSAFGGLTSEKIATGVYNLDTPTVNAMDGMVKGTMSMNAMANEDPGGLKYMADVFKDVKVNIEGIKDKNGLPITINIDTYLKEQVAKEGSDKLIQTWTNASSVLQSEDLSRTLKPAARVQLESFKQGLESWLLTNRMIELDKTEKRKKGPESKKGKP